MIKTFRHRGLEQYFKTGSVKLLNPRLVDRIEKLLDVLDTSTEIGDMNYGGNRLHELKGNRKGTWSVSLSGNWRLTFRFRDGNAYDVDLEDYH